MVINKNYIFGTLLITSLIFPLAIKADGVADFKQKSGKKLDEKSLEELTIITGKLEKKILLPDGTPVAEAQKKFGNYEKLENGLRYLKKDQNYFYFPLIKPDKHVSVALFFKINNGRTQGAFLRYDFVAGGRPFYSSKSEQWKMQQKQLKTEENRKIHYLELIIKKYKLK